MKFIKPKIVMDDKTMHIHKGTNKSKWKFQNLDDNKFDEVQTKNTFAKIHNYLWYRYTNYYSSHNYMRIYYIY